jgi:rhodanese-related sulfurtransferase
MHRIRIAMAVALTVAMALGALPVTAAENPAAWDAAAVYLASLPEGFNGMKGDVLKAKLDAGENLFLLDVRQPNEFAAGRIEGAVNVPVRDLPKSLEKLPSDKTAPIVVICAAAVRSGYVVQALSFKGYTNVKHLAAGYVAGWEKAGYPVVK